jgi:two-component system CheB/CheR fusion protein
LIQDAHDAILLQDLQGCILARNPAAQKMYGWSEAEALAMNIRDLVPERLWQDQLARVQQMTCSEKLKPYFSEWVAKDGSIVKVWLTATVLVNQNGQVYAVTTTERRIQPAESA